MMTKATRDNIILSAVFAAAVLWQMLLPGYVLTLDMVFAPRLGLDLGQTGFYNDSPVRLALWSLNFFLDGWIVQKIMLVALFFLLFYLAARFLPVPKKLYANYWAALFFSINPFVYERFLAGHWMILFAYALLPPFTDGVIGFFRERSLRRLGWLLFWTLLIGVFSLHFLVMALLVVMGCFFAAIMASLKDRARLFRTAKFAAVFGALFLVLSSYWLAPYALSGGQSHLDTINRANQLAFKTAGATGAETARNILTLYGFWGEREPWAGYFLSPRDNAVFWSVISVLLAAIVSVGVWRAWKERKKEAAFFALIALAAFVFSCGLGEGIFKGFNSWLFDHVGFWRGFRDTQKWSGLLALAYAYFGGWGYWHLANGIWPMGQPIKKVILFVLFCLPVLFAYTMVGGFARQLSPIWYPESWLRAKEIIDADKRGRKVLFLPWHQYLSLEFNNEIIVGNPAKRFFGSRIVAGDNMEVGGIFSQSVDKENLDVQDLILDENIPLDEAVDKLEMFNISHILVMDNAVTKDYLRYPLLGSDRLLPVFHSGDLTLFSIGGKIK